MNEVKTYAVNCNDAWLNTNGDDISGSYVKYADYLELAVQLANAESKCRELAVENSTIKVMNDCLSEEMRGYESDGAFDGPKMHLLWWKTETPATDAFLDEVRAQGVDASIEHLSKKFEGTGHIGVPVMALEWLAQEIRKGAAQ